MPEGGVYVGRPTKYGNPFPLFGQENPAEPLLRYQRYLAKTLLSNPTFLDELKGKDLACWCKEGAPCHADILLKLANREVCEV